jgi:hypothetical protein
LLSSNPFLLFLKTITKGNQLFLGGLPFIFKVMQGNEWRFLVYRDAWTFFRKTSLRSKITIHDFLFIDIDGTFFPKMAKNIREKLNHNT